MNAAQFKGQLDAIIATATELRKQLEADEKVDPTPIYMSMREYGKHALVSERTVRKWVKAGLPVVRRGKIIRVKVAEADGWNEEDATRRAAERSAHGAKA